jgi:hypothetical protein
MSTERPEADTEQKINCHCTGSMCLGRVRPGNGVLLFEEGRPPLAMHLSCAVKWVAGLPNGPRKEELKAALVERFVTRPPWPNTARIAQVRAELRARAASLPDADPATQRNPHEPLPHDTIDEEATR